LDLKHDHAKRTYEHPRWTLALRPKLPQPPLSTLLIFFFLCLLLLPPHPHRPPLDGDRLFNFNPCCINARLYIHLSIGRKKRKKRKERKKETETPTVTLPFSRFNSSPGKLNPSTNRLSIRNCGLCASRTTEPLSAHLPSFRPRSSSLCLPAIDLAFAEPLHQLFNRLVAFVEKFFLASPTTVLHRDASS